MNTEKLSAVATAIKCLAEDDLDTLKQIVPQWVDVKIRIKEFVSYSNRQLEHGLVQEPRCFTLLLGLVVNFVSRTCLNKVQKLERKMLSVCRLLDGVLSSFIELHCMNLRAMVRCRYLEVF